VKATEVTAGLAESNDSLLPGLWRDSLHITCGLTDCTPGSAPRPTLGNAYGKTLPFLPLLSFALDTIPVFLILIYHHALLAFNPCLNKELMWLAWMLCLFHYICCIYEIILWIHRKPQINVSLARKINPISGFMRTCPVPAENTEDNL